MNEKIKELAVKAQVEHCISHVRLQEFAELIVGECILTIQMGITRDGPDTEKYLRSMKHIKQIKQHFGVEE